MESANCIGRVGALAVALGIGVALTTGTGIAVADDSGGASSSSDSASSSSGSDSNGSGNSTKPAKTSDDDTAKTPRKGPLSKLGERVRKQAEASAERAGSALERTQSRLERAQSQLGERQATLRSKLEDAGKNLAAVPADGTEAGERPLANLRPRPADPETSEAPTAARDKTGKSDATQLGPAAVAPTPPSGTGRTEIPARRLGDAVATESSRGLAALTGPARTLITIPARNLTPAPITAFAAAAAPTETVTLEAPEAAEVTGTSMVSALLVAAGLSPLAAGTSPVAPGPSAALWALAAAARRESERVLNPRGAALTSAKDADAPAVSTDVQPLAAVAAADTQPWQANPGLTDAPVISGPSILRDLGFITGDKTKNWFIGGTDLGIMWVGGYEEDGTPIVYTLFGDTFDDQAMTTGWRNNVLLRSVDTNLADGLSFRDALIHAGAGPGVPGTPTWYGLQPPAAGAAQIIYDPGYTGWFGTTYTMIPTSAIAVQNAEDGTYTQYATVMSVRTWDNPGSWTTNYSAIAVSTDGGETWTVDPDTVRGSGWLRANKNFEFGNQNFQQNALVQGPDDDPNSWTTPEQTEKYIYVYGTPSGRAGSAYLARVPESQFTDLGAYQYWAGENADGTGNWVTGDPSAATSVIGGGNSNYISFLPKDGFLGQINKMFAGFLNGFIVGGLPTGGNVSEMSVQYNEYLDKYVVTYTDGGNNVVMRVSDSPQGTWSNTHTLIANNPLSGLTGMYAPMIHPLSGTAAAGEGNEQYLYYNVSFWNSYNVKFMESDLSQLVIT